MSDGTLSVRRRQLKASENTASDLLAGAVLRSGAFESFLGNLPTIGQGRVKSKQKSKPTGDADELRVESKRRRRLRDYDRLLKNFKYSAALDSVLRKVSNPISVNNTGSNRCNDFIASPANHNVFADPRAYPSRRTSNSSGWTRRCPIRTNIAPVTQTCRRPQVW